MNQKYLSLLLAGTMLLAALTGCGTKQSAAPAVSASGSASASGAAEAEQPAGTDTGEAVSADSDRELYQSFLNDEETVRISGIYSLLSDSGEAIPELDKDGAYTMTEFLEGFFQNRTAYWGSDYPVDSLEYAFVDCGHDGTQELVLHFISSECGSENSNLMVIKNLNGQLALCFWTEEGYRSYNYINTDGVICSGGSAGASIQSVSYYTIGAEGTREEIYSMETASAYSYDDGTLIDEKDVSDLMIIRYAFEDFDGDYNSTAFQDYLDSCDYTYGRYTDHDTLDESQELYEPDSPYYQFVSMFIKNIHTPSEMDRLLQERLTELGYTEEMLEENEPDWQVWEGHEALFEAATPAG